MAAHAPAASRCATSLLRTKHNFVAGWERKAYMDFRGLVVKLVMMTDLSKHFEFVERLRGMGKGGLLPAEGNADVALVLTVAIKFADLGHTIKAATNRPADLEQNTHENDSLIEVQLTPESEWKLARIRGCCIAAERIRGCCLAAAASMCASIGSVATDLTAKTASTAETVHAGRAAAATVRQSAVHSDGG